MTTPIDTRSVPQLNLNQPLGSGLPFPLPAGTEISCVVTAEGVNDDGADIIETISTNNTVTLVEPSTGPPPSFVPNSLSLTLSDGDGSASIETTGDLDGTSVEWEVTTTGGSGTLTLDDPFNGADKMVIDAGFAFGRNQARLNLSGTGTPGAIVECEDNTTGVWNTIATIQPDGTWQSEDATALVTVNPSHDLSGDWYRVGVRLQGGDGTVVQSTNTFLPGLVFASVSQSELAQAFNDYKNTWEDDEIPLENDHNFQMLYYFVNFGNSNPPSAWTDGEFTGFPERTFFQTDMEGYNRDPVTGYLRRVANMFNQTMPGIPILYVSLNWSGTSRTDMMRETAVPHRRDWKFTSHAVQWCRSRGTEIGIFSEMWYASDLARDLDLNFGPLYAKVNHQGTERYTLPPGPTADYVLGTDFGGPVPCFHCLYDASTGVADNEFGEGLLRKDSTKYNILSTNWFNSSKPPAGFLGATLPPSSDPTHAAAPDRTFKNSSSYYVEIPAPLNENDEVTEYGQIDFNNLNLKAARGSQARWQRLGAIRLTNSEHVKKFMTPMGLDPCVLCQGDWLIDKDLQDSNTDDIREAWSDLTHGAGNLIRGQGIPQDKQERAEDGVMKHMEYQTIEGIKTAGFIDYPIPFFFPVIIPADGSSITLEVRDYHGGSISSDATLETLRSLRGQSPLVRDVDGDIRNGDKTTHNEVMGFEILRASEGGGLQSDVRDEENRAAEFATYEGFDCSFDRTTNNLRVKITPDVPFSSGDVIRYNYGANIGWTFNQRDNSDQVYKSAPILSIPGIPIDGIPVAAWPRTPDIIIP